MKVAAWFPAHLFKYAGVQKLARHAVRFARVEAQFALVTCNVLDQLSEMPDGEPLRRSANIDGCGIAVILHQENTSSGQIIDEDEFALGSTGTPKIDMGL